MMQGELPALTCAQVREVDRRAIAELGIPGMVLMENASRALAGAVHAMRGNSNAPVAILCGGGNNGGDGYALARLLACEGVPSILFAAKDPGELTGDAGRQVHIVRCLGMTIHELAAPDSPARLGACSLWVDALLGTGFRSRIEGALQQAMAPLSALRSAAGGPGVGGGLALRPRCRLRRRGSPGPARGSHGDLRGP
ncbi:MAG: NAD(P)H-hydrate epimerase [Planctomycetota bacterium]